MLSIKNHPNEIKYFIEGVDTNKKYCDSRSDLLGAHMLNVLNNNLTLVTGCGELKRIFILVEIEFIAGLNLFNGKFELLK